MIIACADMAIGDEAAALAPHDHGQFAMRLQFDEAEHHLRAGPFEIARPANIGLLVETRLQFDERGDGLCRPPPPRPSARTIGLFDEVR